MREATVGARGVAVRYTVAGAGPPLVLLHGLAGSARWWRENVAALAAARTVYLVNLPRRVSVADAPMLLCDTLDSLELDKMALVGHSLGGLVSARVAARSPERVERLVLVAPAGVPFGRGAAGHVLPLVQSVRYAPPGFLRLLAADALRAGPHRLARAAWDVLREDLTGELHRIRAPTLLVWGERDALVPATLADAWRRELSDAAVAILPNASHVPMLEQPREFERVVLDFLGGSAVPPEEAAQRAVEP